MTNEQRQRLREIHRQMRASYMRIFDLQGEAINALREATTAVAQTHDEMMTMFQVMADLEDTTDETDA